MGLREIRERLAKLSWLWLRSAPESVPDRNEIFESGSQADPERRHGPECRFEVRRRANGHGPASSLPMRRKTDTPARSTASAGKHAFPGDIARRVLGAGAAISNVLVVGTDGSKPIKRMEIHFEDRERVPAAFSSLAAALESSGFDFDIARNSSIPPTEIWLTYPLNDRKKTLLSCAARVGEQQAERVAVQTGSPRGQTDNHASVPTRSRS